MKLRLLFLLTFAAWPGGAETPRTEVSLENGLPRPAVWPPTDQRLSRTPADTDPPYLAHPPVPIGIDHGRQLFVDDFLVEATTLRRTWHLPVYHPASPVLAPDRPWEGRHAAPFSDGVWYDSADGLFKMWYWAEGGEATQHRGATCLATSRDGVAWIKPAFDVVPDTNVVLVDDPGEVRNSSTVWLDPADARPERRFKMFRNVQGKSGEWHLHASYSPDGIHWVQGGYSTRANDRTTVFYNSLRGVWVASLRSGGHEKERTRAYYEHADPEQMLQWRTPEGKRKDVDWIGADDLDPGRGDLNLSRSPERPFDLTPSQLYNLDCVAYESVLLGLFSIWRGQQVKPLPKINEICAGFSRDGFHWSRPDRRPFCPVEANAPVWNSGNLQSAGGCCLVVGDRLFFYVSAVAKGAQFADPMNVGLASLRRDGFASMDAAGSEGILTTRLVRFTGKHLFVNAALAHGSLRAELLDEAGAPLAPFTAANCLPVAGDNTRQQIGWKNADDLSPLIGRLVRVKFYLTQGELYAFWVSPSKQGESNGFVGAGGPGYLDLRDSVRAVASP